MVWIFRDAHGKVIGRWFINIGQVIFSSFQDDAIKFYIYGSYTIPSAEGQYTLTFAYERESDMTTISEECISEIHWYSETPYEGHKETWT